MKIRADMILRQLQKRHFKRGDVFLTEIKNGPSWNSSNLLILDALAIRKSWTKPCFTGYEVKVNRSDFLRDQKWPGYLQYCHEFYFACPVGLISPEELPKGVGLIYYNLEKDCISTKRKALYRPIEISTEMLMYIITAKFDSDRHPFFSDRREQLEAWVQDKISRRDLGYRVNMKLLEKISQLEKENSELKRQVDDICLFKEIEKVFEKHGYWNRGKWADDLDKALSASIPPKVIADINMLSQLVESLRRAVS